MAKRRRRFEIRVSPRTAHIAAAAFGVVLLAAVVGCVVYQFEPRPAAPPEREVVAALERLDRIEGWVPSWGDEARIAAEAAQAGFTDLLFFHGTVGDDGVVKLEDTAGLEGGRIVAVRAAVRTWLTVTNHGKSLEGALGTGRLNAHADSLLRAFAESRCQHLDLDYESLTSAQARALPELARILAPRLGEGSRLSFTLQPVDGVFRPGHSAPIRELLAMREIYTVRFMMYDYHWSGSLPGALCPIDAFERLLHYWPGHANRLTVCLPLYGYDWPRPMDTTLPRAKSVTLRDVPALERQPGFEAAWMEAEAELACRYGTGAQNWVAVPSFGAVTRRVTLALEHGVPAVSFWHLGCGRLDEVAEASRRNAEVPEVVSAAALPSWDTWLEPFKRQVCTVVRGDGRSLEEYARAHGVERAHILRFNEHIESDTSGLEVFIPRKP